MKNTKPWLLSVSASAWMMFALSACLGGSGFDQISHAPGSPPAPPSFAPPSAGTRAYSVDVLLFDGSGTWGAEVSSLESILTSQGQTYDVVGSSALDSMSVDDMAKYGLMIFPGGSGGTEAGSLSAKTHANIREAVQSRGVSYLGFCAGAFIAVAPAPKAGGDVSYGLGIVNGAELDYYGLEAQGIDIAMTMYTFADGSKKDILYYGGPVVPNIPGGVIARYPDGNPSISEMWSGNGLVILSGGHPTATQATLSGLGVSSSDGTHLDVAGSLITAALKQKPLPAF